MHLIALTGGIASGKTLVSDRFAELGVPVIDADLLAREVVAPGTPGLAAVAAHFGAGVLQANGSLDRAALRALVFQDAAARAALDELLHPRIRALGEQRVVEARASGARYAVYAIPLLFETAQTDRFDRVLVVDLPESLQIERLVRRDGIDQAAAQRMLAAQASRSQRLAIADDVIENTGSSDATRRQVDALHQRYLDNDCI